MIKSCEYSLLKIVQCFLELYGGTTTIKATGEILNLKQLQTKIKNMENKEFEFADKYVDNTKEKQGIIWELSPFNGYICFFKSVWHTKSKEQVQKDVENGDLLPYYNFNYLIKDEKAQKMEKEYIGVVCENKDTIWRLQDNGDYKCINDTFYNDVSAIEILSDVNNGYLIPYNAGLDFDTDKIASDILSIHPGTNVDTNKEVVNGPAHYGGKDNVYEAIKVIEAWNLNFNLGNLIKYISRAGKKNKDTLLEDLKKASWYLNREINNIENGK